MKKRVLVLGAGFGGLELTTMLSEAFGDGLDVTLIDKGDAFTFGFSKLDVMFGRTTPDAVRLPYKDFAKPGVRLLQEKVTSIDPVARRVTTDRGTHEADFLVVALGADYDFAATPGLAEATEFYTVAGAARLGGSAAWTWISFPIPTVRPAPTTSRRSPCAPTRSTSARAAAPGGSTASPHLSQTEQRRA